MFLLCTQSRMVKNKLTKQCNYSTEATIQFDVDLLSFTTIDVRSNGASASLIFLPQEAAIDTQRHASAVAERMLEKKTVQCATVFHSALQTKKFSESTIS